MLFFDLLDMYTVARIPYVNELIFCMKNLDHSMI